MKQPDLVIHQPVRLKIMAALKPLPPSDQIEFVRLRKLVDATEGNLGAHIQTLEQAGYVAVEKDFADSRPRTNFIMRGSMSSSSSIAPTSMLKVVGTLPRPRIMPPSGGTIRSLRILCVWP